MTNDIDHARLAIILNDLRLPSVKHVWSIFPEAADKAGWQAARFLATFAERDRRRFERRLAEGRLPPGKPLDSFDFKLRPMIPKAHVMAICAGDSWLDKGANPIVLGGPGCGRISPHLRHRPGLIENGWRGAAARLTAVAKVAASSCGSISDSKICRLLNK